MASFKLVCAIVLCMVVIAPMTSEATITCGTVTTNLAPCINYLRRGGTVTTGCCNGVKALNNAARTTPDRQAACECIKTAAKTVGGVSEGNAASLPGKCGVNIPYKFSTSTNCKNVK